MDRSFGSFVSSNVDKFLLDTDDTDKDYDLAYDQYYNLQQTHDPRLLFPYLRKNVIYLNHGAFGLTLGRTLDLAQKYQISAESDPCRFYDREYIPLAIKKHKLVSKFLKCALKNFVFVQNVTNGISTVLQTLRRHYKPISVLLLSCTYLSTTRMLISESCKDLLISIVKINAMEDDDTFIVDSVRAELERKDFHLAIFDHITSQHARVMPILQLYEVCKTKNVLTVVDGAHSLGLILPSKTLSFTAFGDYYITSCHKWFCGHKGLAILIFNDKVIAPIPCIRSHGLEYGTQSEFIWSGLHDYSAILSISDTIAFWNVFDIYKVMESNHRLCVDVSNYLAKLWNTKVLNQAGSMACIKLAVDINYFENTELCDGPLNYNHAEYIQNKLFNTTPKSIQVSVKLHVPKNDETYLYVRICVHIYNCNEEYVEFGKRMLELCADYKCLV